MKKYANSIISLLLVISLLIAMLPVSALAESMSLETEMPTVQDELSVETEPTHQIISEDVSRRDEYYKEFILDSGLRMASLYAEPVHYSENGQWKEIDNTLKLSADAYTNTAGPWTVSFPQTLSREKAVSITKDGYTLSFYLAGELRQQTGSLIRSAATMDEAQPAQLQSVKESTAQLQQVDKPSEQTASKYPQLSTEKLSSRLQYAQVYTGTDIVYDLTGNQVKESIVMSSYNAGLRGYRYTLNVGDLQPVLTESGEIHLYDSAKENIVLLMPAPFLVDDAGEYCHDVRLTLTGSGSQYTLTYLLPQQWLADSNRQWPVILDPAVKANLDCTNIQDVTVYSELDPENYKSGILDMGYHISPDNQANKGIMRSFLKYVSLPSLTSADVVVYAQFSLYKPQNSGTTSPVEIHKVLGSWDVTTTEWANQPAISSTVEDHAIVQLSGWYHWDITDTVRGWYEGANNGLALKTPEWVENGSVGASFKQFYSSDYSSGSNPVLQIVFRNNNGLESYWDYTASSAGRAGTGYVNEYTGNLVWTHNDIGFGGNRMPVSISHIYNANDCNTNNFGVGYGWRTNYHQTLSRYTVQDGTTNKTYYRWDDADGTDHYFCQNDDGVYVDEDGLELTLTLTSDNYLGNIKDKEGNTYYFDTQGRLCKLENNQQTKSIINITFLANTGHRINTITDGVGRKYQFEYRNNLVTGISYYASGSTKLEHLEINFSGSDPIKFTYSDGKYSWLTYYDNHLLMSARDIDGYQLTYTYTTQDSGKPSRVRTVTETHNGKTGSSLTLTYAHNQTTFTDNLGNVQIKQFNNWGNTTSVRDNEGRAQFAVYARNDLEETTKGNQLLVSSKLQNTVGNMINNSSFEHTGMWGTNSSTASITNAYAYCGYKSMTFTKNSSAATGYVSTSAVTAEAGKTYTFSAYVRTGSSGSAYLSLGPGTPVYSQTVSSPDGWTRLQVSYTNTTSENQSIYCRVLTKDTGPVYVDAVQLEKAETASRFNIIENGDFRHGADGWTKTYYCDGYEMPITLSASPATELNKTAFRFKGDPDHPNRIWQQVMVRGNKDDTLVLAGWVRGEGVPMTEFTDDVRKFTLSGTFAYTDGTTGEFEFDFNPDVGGEMTWQYVAGAMVAKKDYSSVNVQIMYDYGANTVYFDGIQLYKEEFGSSYAYDDDGNVKSVRDIQGQITKYEYATNNTDLLKVIQNNTAKVTYTYDSYHNVKTAKTAKGTDYEFTYDTYGNNTSVSVVNDSSRITSTAVYTSDGNRLSYTNDALGNKTTYGYNANTNVLEWVKYPEDTDATRTEYSYDNMYRLTEAALTTDTNLSLSAKYSYENDLLKSIQTGSTTYNFAYGDFALRSSIKVGRQTLASYTYQSGTNRLQQLTYGNDDRVAYTYDTQGKVTKQTYEDNTYVTYKYDNSGALATVYDSQSALTTTYYYDFTDRLMKYVEKGTGVNHSVAYEFDKLNNMTALSEYIGTTWRKISYGYDDDNRPTSVTAGNSTFGYAYDAYGRVSTLTAKHDGTVFNTKTYAYKQNANGTPTSQVSGVTFGGSWQNKTYSYTYDKNGNITGVSDGTYTTSYVYDSANQLIRENNQEANTTTVWTYDDAGNITSRQVYPYTTGTPANRTQNVAYTYNNTNWGDLLTAYNGTTITYDGIGNPLTDGTWTYTWQHGRQLKTMAKSGETWQYTYNADGLRTKRTSGSRTYQYTYAGGQLTHMTVDGHTLYFTYDASGTPLTLTYDGNKFYYVTNLQGDVISIVNGNGREFVHYTYDAWGNPIATDGSATNLCFYNPLRYRGYVYDPETELYYVSSRYYNPEIGRWINADGELSDVGGDILGNNLFAYCFNNPVNMDDPSGNWPKWLNGALNVVGGALQIAAGAALGATVGWTGFGAVVAGFLIVNGTATAAQGVGQIVNHVTNSNVMPEDNIVRTGVQEVGRAIGGDTGAKIAGGAYDVAVVAANLYAGKVGLQQAGKLPIKVNINNVVNNPSDEFVTIGPADGVIQQYCRTIPQSGYGKIYATQLGNGLYQIANGHHRVAALRALGYETIKIFLTK